MPALGRGNPRSSSAMRHRAPAHADGNIQLLRPRRVGAAAGYTTEGVTLNAGEDSERTHAEPPTSDPPTRSGGAHIRVLCMPPALRAKRASGADVMKCRAAFYVVCGAKPGSCEESQHNSQARTTKGHTG